MKTFTRGFCAALVALSIIGMTGCADNEGEANKLGKAMGDPGEVNPKALGATAEAAPTSQKEFYERQQKTQQDMLKQGYPGGGAAKKKK